MKEDELVDFIGVLAKSSGQIIRPYFANPNLEVDTKADSTPVTEADRRAETHIRQLIRRYYPSHGIVGEEFGEENTDSEFVWILDPIDGTKAFAAGCPLFGTLICLARNGKPWFGAIHLPATNQLMVGNGRMTTLNGRPVRIGDLNRIDQALLLGNAPELEHRTHWNDNWLALRRRVATFKTWGDCFGYFLLSTGNAHIMVDPIMNPWDYMALIPVLQGAGAVVTDWQGNDPVGGDSIVAAVPGLHETVIHTLNQPAH